MKIKISQAPDLVTMILQAKLVPMIHGSPAVGKSAIVRRIAKQFKLKLIDLRLSQCDPTDLMGFPKIHGTRAGYVPMDTFPIEGDAIPEGYNGWLLFLDEFNSAPMAVQAAAYKLVLDRMVGQHNLHKNVAVVCAGNLETDGAIVQPMSTALQSRLIHLEVMVDVKQWCLWADEEHIDARITSYLGFRPDQIYTFHPDHSDKTYASPRTWEFTHKLLAVRSIDRETLPVYAGTLSEGVAREFMGFCQIEDKLPKMEAIERAPNSTFVPDEPSAHHALCGALAAHMTLNNCSALLDYIARIPAEFQVTAIRRSAKRNPELMGHSDFGKWVTKFAAEMM